MKKRVDKERKATKTFFKGFKDFIMKGNVIDLAVGVIIGGAFGKIVTSLVNDIIMPPIGLLLGNVDFKDLAWIIKAESVVDGVTIPAITIDYGNFIMVIVEFLIIAFSIYFVLTLIIRRNEFKEKLEQEEAERLKALEEKAVEEKIVAPSEEILLLREIRDSLKNKETDKWQWKQKKQF